MSTDTSTLTQEYVAPVDALEADALATDATMDATEATTTPTPTTPATPTTADATTPTLHNVAVADAPPALKRASRADFFGDEDEGAPLPLPFKRQKTVVFAARELGPAFEEEGAPGQKRPSAEEWLADESQHAKDDAYSTPERVSYVSERYKCDSVGTHFLQD